MLYCYFIARSGPELQKVSYRTVHPGPICFVQQHDLLTAVRALPPGSRSTLPLMLEHNLVLSAASEQAAILPMPFGTAVSAEETLAQLLEARRAEILEALDRLGGKAEMALRITLRPDEDPQDRAGQIAGICQPLQQWFEVRPDGSGEAVLEIAHLIHRQEADQYRKRLETQAAKVNGPRPPFHFLPPFLRKPVKSESRPGRAVCRRDATG
ncbi:MAG TPA: GvpL/GvpF family gas vesicle protein [Bryobacterales bacterium]|nr:GvpL/GvpF family gas vesicle protein [Bryobacterales bacterium]